MKQLIFIAAFMVLIPCFSQKEIDTDTYEFYGDTRDGGEIWKHKKSKKYGVFYPTQEPGKFEVKFPFEYDKIEEERYFDRALVGSKNGKQYLLNADEETAMIGFKEVVCPEDRGIGEVDKPFLLVREDYDYQIYQPGMGVSYPRFSSLTPLMEGNYYNTGVLGIDGTLGLYDFQNMAFIFEPRFLDEISYTFDINSHCGREDLMITRYEGKKGLIGLESDKGVELLKTVYDDIQILSLETDWPSLKVITGDSMNFYSPYKKEMLLPKMVPLNEVNELTYLGDKTYIFTKKGKSMGVFSSDLSTYIPTEYKYIDLNEDHPEMINVYTKKKAGVFKNGEEYIPCQYTEIDPMSGVAEEWTVIRVFDKKKQGMYMDHVLAIPCEYDQIHEDMGGHWFAVSKGKKFGLYNSGGDLVLPLEYDSIQLMNGDLGKVAYLLKDGKAWYYSEDGKFEETKVSER